jgi:hypothetical protein
MAGNDSKDLWRLRMALMPLLDGVRPSRVSGWVPFVAPVVTQAGAGHWAAGRRQRAVAEWTGAAGFGLVAWGLGTEAPTGAEVLENMAALPGMEGQQRDLLRKLAAEGPRLPPGRRHPRPAVGSALAAAGSVARLRAASAEPLR